MIPCKRVGAAFVVALCIALMSVAVSAVSASGIVGGVVDGTAHRNVGALVAELNGQKNWECSGVLVSSTVFVTAGHCTAYLESLGIADTAVWVTFDPVFDATAGTFLSGTMHTNPAFNRTQSDPSDLGVVVLNSPIGITPAQLPSAGLLDSLAAAHGLAGQTFTAVGYGSDQRLFGGPPRFSYDGVRRSATSTFNALNPAWLRLSQNPATGNGGTCYGDSGGPNFLGTSQIIAAVTNGGDTVCRATNVDYRLDTRTARAFLGNYVTLP